MQKQLQNSSPLKTWMAAGALSLALCLKGSVCCGRIFGRAHATGGPNRERDADCTIVNGFRVVLRDKRNFATAEKIPEES